MDHIAITRQDDTSIPVSPAAFRIHLYPFTTLPTLVSHIHPNFVIISAGIQLHEMVTNRLKDFIALRQMFPGVMDILALYTAWTANPRDYHSDASYWPPYDASNDDDNDNEGNNRDDPKDKHPHGKRKIWIYQFISQEAEGGSPTKNPSKTSKEIGAHHDPADCGNLSSGED